jgi:hypothetical protein
MSDAFERMSLYLCNTILTPHKQLHVTNNGSFLRQSYVQLLFAISNCEHSHEYPGNQAGSFVARHVYLLNPIHILLFINFKVLKILQPFKLFAQQYFKYDLFVKHQIKTFKILKPDTIINLPHNIK